MSERCDRARDWLARQGVGLPEGEQLTASQAAHVASCPSCRATLQRYRAFAQASEEELDHEPAPHAAERFTQAARAAVEGLPELALRSAAEAALEHRPGPEAAHRLLEAARAQRDAARRPLPRLGIGIALALAAALLLALLSWDALGPAESPLEPVIATPSELLPADDGPPRPAPRLAAETLVRTTGSVTLDGQPWTGEGLSPSVAGRSLATGPGGAVAISDGGDHLSIGAESEARIAAWGPEHTRLILQRGSLEATVSPRSPEHPFEVLTPQARIVVVGTRFSVAVTPGAETIVRTLEGLVRVERSDGALLELVAAGQELRVSTPAPDPVRGDVPPPLSGSPPPEPPQAQEALLQHGEPRATPRALDPLEQARAWLGEGQDDMALSVLQALPADDWERDALLGDAHRIGGRLAEAEQAYTRALSNTPLPPGSVVAELATVQQARGRHSEAAVTWARYLAAYPRGSEAPSAHLALGLWALEQEAPEEADEHLRAVLSLAPDSPQAVEALVSLARQLFEQERWKEAEALFTPLTEGAGPCAEPALVGLIRVSLGQGRHREAAALVERYHLQYPSGARAHEVELLEQMLPSRWR